MGPPPRRGEKGGGAHAAGRTRQRPTKSASGSSPRGRSPPRAPCLMPPTQDRSMAIPAYPRNPRPLPTPTNHNYPGKQLAVCPAEWCGASSRPGPPLGSVLPIRPRVHFGASTPRLRCVRLFSVVSGAADGLGRWPGTCLHVVAPAPSPCSTNLHTPARASAVGDTRPIRALTPPPCERARPSRLGANNALDSGCGRHRRNCPGMRCRLRRTLSGHRLKRGTSPPRGQPHP